MKVLILSTYDVNGGAAIAAYRLLNALINKGIDAKMLVAHKQSSHERIIEAKSIFGPKYQKINLALEKGFFLKDEKDKSVRFQFSTARFGYHILNEPAIWEADVIHLHWTLQGFLSLKEIELLQSVGKKIVWTLHDMWVFTGGCHYAGECKRYENSCGQCPFLRHPSENDLSHQIWSQKNKIYQDVSFVTCSLWLAKVAKKSSLLQHHSICAIANPIDTNVYFPSPDKSKLRTDLDWDNDKKYILFGAASLSDTRKGIKYFIEALRLYALAHQDLPVIVLYGGQKEEIQIPGYEVKHLGYLHPQELIQYYQACDLYAITSLEDNLPNTVMESLSCGLPVLSFDTGGIPEMVMHQQNGYVAEYRSVEDLKNGLENLLGKMNLKELSVKARNSVVEKYSQDIIAEKYLQLYNLQ